MSRTAWHRPCVMGRGGANDTSTSWIPISCTDVCSSHKSAGCSCVQGIDAQRVDGASHEVSGTHVHSLMLRLAISLPVAVGVSDSVDG